MDENIKHLKQIIKHLENEIKVLHQEKDETAEKFYNLFTEMETEVRRRSSLIQEQNFKLQQEIEKRKKAECNLRKTLVEKDYLFKELHHRVKNNLQLISSIMNLQIKSSTDDKFIEALKASQQKLKSMAITHDFIYNTDSSDRIDLSEYITFLAKEIFRSCEKHFSLRKLDIDIDSGIITPLKVSLPCGLIVNELITNAITHAFDEKEKGRIAISLQQTGDYFQLTIQDNGKGIDPENLFSQEHCLGLNLVKLLAENQLKGKLRYTCENGSKFEIQIPNPMEAL